MQLVFECKVFVCLPKRKVPQESLWHLSFGNLPFFISPLAGGCLDGKQHLALGDLAGKGGMKNLSDALGTKTKTPKPKPKPKEGEVVEPESPLSKAQNLLAQVMKDSNQCRHG